MLTLGLLFFACMLLVGVMTGIWKCVTFLAGLLTPPAPPPRPALAALSRKQILDVLEGELERDSLASAVSASARDELAAYLRSERQRMATPPGIAPLPLPQPEQERMSTPPVIVAPALELAPEPKPQAPALPSPQPQAMRSPQALREKIAKLHADAQAPVPQVSPQSAAPQSRSLESSAPVRGEARAGFSVGGAAQAAAPGLPEATPIPSVAPVQPPAQLKRSIEERLFTPENVRILQSLGIGIIFISAVAFVKMNMWEGAELWQQLALLLGGTAACTAAGYALRCWTSLRITGLGFLILGQLAIVLDTYAALVNQGTGLPPLYPWAPSSLWMFSMLVFSASAWWHARTLREPLFDAFTFFGGMAVYGSAAVFFGITGAAGERWWLLPAAYVPALALCAWLAAWIKTRALALGCDSGRGCRKTDGCLQASGWRRWTLWWWMDAAWHVGAGVLVVILPPLALWPGRTHLGDEFIWHAAALFTLGAGLLVTALRSGNTGYARLSALALLSITPLLACAQHWPWQQWCLAWSPSGAALLLASQLLDNRLRAQPLARDPLQTLQGIGTAGLALGAGWALLCWAGFDLPASYAAWSSGALLACGLTLALLDGKPSGAWLATCGTGFSMALAADALTLPVAWWPALGLAGALALQGAWRLVRNHTSVAEQGRQAADLLACCATLLLAQQTMAALAGAAWHGHGLPSGWLVFAGYMLAIAAVHKDAHVLRVSTGIGALGPALATWLYTQGFTLCVPAPWLAGLAALVQVTAWLLYGTGTPDAATNTRRNAWCLGAGELLLQGAVLALVLSAQDRHGDAAVAFAVALLAAVPLALRLRQADHPDNAWIVLAELAAMGLYAGAGIHAAYALGVTEPAWPLALSLLGAVALLFPMLIQALTHGFKTVDVSSSLPFASLAPGVALFCGFIGTMQVLGQMTLPTDRVVLLYATWGTALLPALLALRSWGQQHNPTWYCLPGGALAVSLAVLAVAQALWSEFWLATCTPDMRGACASFFGILFLASLLAWLRRRLAFAPFTGIGAMLGLIGCAYGAWTVPPESFGLACVALAAASSFLGAWLRRHESCVSQAVAFEAAGLAVNVLGAIHLIQGLWNWPSGPTHFWAMAAWAILAHAAWRTAWNESKPHLNGAAAWAAGCACVLALCHTLRGLGWDWVQFGPILAGAALLLQAAREVAHTHSLVPASLPQDDSTPKSAIHRGAGTQLAVVTTAMASFMLGLTGWASGYVWSWAGTLELEALLLAAWAVLARRQQARTSPAGLMLLELGAWSLAVIGLCFGLTAGGLAWLITPPTLVLAAAGCLLWGMLCEALAGAVLLSDARLCTPRPFLESRHITSIALFAAGVCWAFGASGALARPEIEHTWRALLAAGILAAYLGMAEWSAADSFRNAGRLAAGLAAYLVLIPGGYLCLLKAHSTGSDWGALWFMALAPVQLAAAWALEREQHAGQSMLARTGTFFTALGACVLAFAGNPARLPEVPCLTFAALLLLALLGRACSPADRHKAYALGGLFALAGMIFHAWRWVAGDAAYGLADPSVWEWPVLAALGVTLVMAGGLARWEPDAQGRSLAGIFGAALSLTASLVAFAMLALHGLEAQYLPMHNLARFEAFIVTILLLSGLSMAARRWLRWPAGSTVAPVLALLGYGLYVWTMHPGAWEWYSLPAAVLLFAWARSLAHEASGPDNNRMRSEVTVLLSLASATALLPSFIQALPATDSALGHFCALLISGLALVGGAMLTQRKVPLLAGSSSILLLTLIKTAQWAAQREVIMPVAGIAVGFAVLAVGCLFESRMNQALRATVDRVRAEARMFWVSWE